MITSELVKELENIVSPERAAQGELLAGHCSFRTGGPADLFVQVCTEDELVRVLDLLGQSGTDVFLLGRGTNLLIGDGGYRGAVVTMCGPLAADSELCQVKVDGCRIRAGAGASLLKIAMAAKDAGLAGLEFAAGIPGSLGGAVMMNAGAYNGEMKQVIRSVRILDPASGIKRFSDAEMEFGYRTSRLKKKSGIVLSAEMELEPGDKQVITDRITELAQKRREKQPMEFASAGSTFKRPEGLFAGKLIQDAGLRGYSIGDAQVSEKHAGFVINRGNASAAQIRKLIEDVQRIVLEDSGVQLEREVIFLGEF